MPDALPRLVPLAGDITGDKIIDRTVTLSEKATGIVAVTGAEDDATHKVQADGVPFDVVKLVKLGQQRLLLHCSPAPAKLQQIPVSIEFGSQSNNRSHGWQVFELQGTEHWRPDFIVAAMAEDAQEVGTAFEHEITEAVALSALSTGAGLSDLKKPLEEMIDFPKGQSVEFGVSFESFPHNTALVPQAPLSWRTTSKESRLCTLSAVWLAKQAAPAPSPAPAPAPAIAYFRPPAVNDLLEGKGRDKEEPVADAIEAAIAEARDRNGRWADEGKDGCEVTLHSTPDNAEFYVDRPVNLAGGALKGVGQVALHTDQPITMLRYDLGRDVQRLISNPPVLENIQIGFSGPSRQGSTGLLLSAPNLTTRHVSIYGFERGLAFGDYAYAIHMDQTKIGGCRVGVYWGRMYRTSGERITMHGGTVSRNEVGVLLNHTQDRDGDGLGDGLGGGPGFNMTDFSVTYNSQHHIVVERPGEFPDDIYFLPWFTRIHFEIGHHEPVMAARGRIVADGAVGLAQCRYWDFDPSKAAGDDTVYPYSYFEGGGFIEFQGGDFAVPGDDRRGPKFTGRARGVETLTQRYITTKVRM